jgi:hypothetical protein
MLIVVDLAERRVSLTEPSEFTHFSVAVEGAVKGAGGEDGDRSELADVVRGSGLGRLREDGEHVVVDPAALRVLAGPAADEAWDEGLSGMVAYAAGKGWVEDGGVVAHIERRGAAG